MSVSLKFDPLSKDPLVVVQQLVSRVHRLVKWLNESLVDGMRKRRQKKTTEKLLFKTGLPEMCSIGSEVLGSVTSQ